MDDMLGYSATRRAEIRGRLEGSSYGRVALELGIPKATLWRWLEDGYEPRKPSIRIALGLPVTDIPPGTIVMGRPVTCRCGRVFVGKWGDRRRLCPVCRPPKTTIQSDVPPRTT